MLPQIGLGILLEWWAVALKPLPNFIVNSFFSDVRSIYIEMKPEGRYYREF